MYIESNHSLQFIGLVFGYKDHSAVSRIIDAWMPQFGEVGRSLSIFPNITFNFIDESEPQSHIDLGLKKMVELLMARIGSPIQFEATEIFLLYNKETNCIIHQSVS